MNHGCEKVVPRLIRLLVLAVEPHCLVEPVPRNLALEAESLLDNPARLVPGVAVEEAGDLAGRSAVGQFHCRHDLVHRGSNRARNLVALRGVLLAQGFQRGAHKLGAALHDVLGHSAGGVGVDSAVNKHLLDSGGVAPVAKGV